MSHCGERASVANPDHGRHASGTRLAPVREKPLFLAVGTPRQTTIIAMDGTYAHGLQPLACQQRQIGQPLAFASARLERGGRCRSMTDKGGTYLAAHLERRRTDARPEPGQPIAAGILPPALCGQRLPHAGMQLFDHAIGQSAPASMRRADNGEAAVRQQHRQTIRHHHGTADAWLLRETGIGLRRTALHLSGIDHLHALRRPRLPEAVKKRERELRAFDKAAGEEIPPALEELEKLRAVPYAEIKALRKYLDGHSPFETKHGVKGAEFENVLVVIGRGWNQYNFGEMLELAGAQAVPAAKEAAYERNRNLFYVACSRPKTRLALLFTQQLSPQALATLAGWFGVETISSAPAA